MSKQNNNPKKHHTVPVGYLKNFTDENGLNWLVTSELKMFSNIPKNILNRKDYNTITFDDGTKSFMIESGYLNQIERDFAEVNDSKINNLTPLTKEDKAKLAVFVAAQHMRTEGRRDAMLDFMNRIEESTRWVDELTEEQKIKLAEQNNHLHPGGDDGIPVSELLKHRDDMSTFMASGLPDNVEGIAPIIYDMHWALIYDKNGRFITSDDPVVLVNPTLDAMNGGKGTWMRAGLAQDDVELSFPLTQHVQLLAGWKLSKDLHYVNALEPQIEEFNRRQLRHSRTIVLSSEAQAIARLREIKIRNRLYEIRNVLARPFKEMLKEEVESENS
jgi:hypothetical protein